MCHHLGYPPRVIAAWVPHSGSRCGVSPTSGITHEVMCRVTAPSGMDAVKHSVRSWFVHSGTSLRLVCPAMSGTHIIRRCPTHHSSQWFVRHWFVQHTLGGGGNVRDVVLRRTSQSPCLVDSEQPMTVHPVMGKTPSQIGQTSLFLALWSPFTNMGCAAPAMDVFVSSLIARGMGVLVDVDAYHVHRSPITFTVRLLFVFSRLLSSSWVGSSVSVSPRECPSSCVTRTLGCSSESVPASTGQQLNAPHLPE